MCLLVMIEQIMRWLDDGHLGVFVQRGEGEREGVG